MYVCMYVCVCMCVCMYVCVCVCFVYVRVCVYDDGALCHLEKCQIDSPMSQM
jgi:hypothetical protein